MLYILLAFILFALMMLGVISKSNNLLVISYIIYIVLYDWIYLSISFMYTSSLISVLKLSQELVIGAVLLEAVANKRILLKKGDMSFCILILIPALLSICMSIFSGHSISDIITGLRLYYIPVIFPFILSRCGYLNNISKQKVVNVILLLAIANVIYGIIQITTFNGDLSSLWFYEYANEGGVVNRIDTASYNYVRDGVLRASGTFVTPIIYTSFLAMSAILVLKNKTWSTSFPIAIFLVYGIHISQTRVGYVMLLLYIAIIFCQIIIPKQSKISIYFVYLLPILAIVGTFVSMFFGPIGDASALGRIVQYLEVPNIFSPLGLGIGNPDYSIIKYDSLYISLIAAVGLFSYSYIRYYLILINNIYLNNDGFSVSVASIGIVCIYAFAFQFMAGSASFRILYLILFIALGLKHNKNIANSTL